MVHHFNGLAQEIQEVLSPYGPRGLLEQVQWRCAEPCRFSIKLIFKSWFGGLN